MGITTPYHRNYRAIKKASNSGYSGWAYIIDRQYATNPRHFVRAYQIIQEDSRNCLNISSLHQKVSAPIRTGFMNY